MSELSKIEYDWWQKETEKYFNKPIFSIKLFKDEIEVAGVYYKKEDILAKTGGAPPVISKVII